MLAPGFVRICQTVWKLKKGTHTQSIGMYSCFLFSLIYYYNNNNNNDYYYSLRPSARSLTKASPVFFLQSLMSCRCTSMYSYWAIWPYSSTIHLSIYTLAFQWAFSLRKVFPSIRSGILLSNIRANCPAHSNLLTRMYPLFNKIQVAWNFLSPELEVTWRTFAIIIRVVLFSPYLRIPDVSLYSIHYNQSHRIY
jgi:hypothetical protein